MRNWMVFALGILFVASAVTAQSADPIRPTETIPLLKADSLEGWELFLKVPDADTAKTWTVSEGVVHCTGVPPGYMRTLKTYADYTLHVEWRWAAEPGNSGVLVHVSAPDKVWPRSIEAQLRSRDAGDFFVIGGTEFNERKGEKKRRTVKKQESNEKPAGEWNIMEVVCKGDRIDVFVNGLLQNTATGCTVDSGHIALQSEGAPIEFRNVYLAPPK